MNWVQLKKRSSNQYLHLYFYLDQYRKNSNFKYKYDEINDFVYVLNYIICRKRIIKYRVIRNIRVYFFKGHYRRSSRFLRFCTSLARLVLKYPPTNNTQGAISVSDMKLGWGAMDFKLQFFSANYLVRSQFFDSVFNIGVSQCGNSGNTDFWVDNDFDELVNLCIDDFIKFYDGGITRGIYEKLPLSKDSQWYHPIGYPNLGIFFLNLSNQMLENFLIYNVNQKNNLSASVFQSWQNANRIGRVTNSGVTNRVISSFQIQFDYTVHTALNSYISDFSQVYWFNAIEQEMYNLPFLFSGLRPGFNNPKLFEVLERKGVLHKAAVYHLNVAATSRFVFDRYLYDHAKFLLTIPFKYQLIPQVKYVINFGSVINSLYFNYLPNKFQFDYFKNFKFLYPLNIHGCNNVVFLNKSVRIEAFVRKSFIVQIILNFWKLFVKLKPYFAIVNSSFYTGVSNSNAFFLRRDPNSGVFFGVFDDQSFDRVTRRLFFPFSKFLYSSSIPVLIAILIYIRYQKNNVPNLSGNWGVLGFDYVNTLTEFEKWHRGQEAERFINKSIFESWFFDFLEQFYDYELWLYVYLQSIFNFLDVLFVCRFWPYACWKSRFSREYYLLKVIFISYKYLYYLIDIMTLSAFFKKFLMYKFNIRKNSNVFEQVNKYSRISAAGMIVFFLLGKPAVDFVLDGSMCLSSFFFTLLFSPLLAGGFLFFESNSHWVRSLSFFYSVIIFSGMCLLFSVLDPEEPGFQIFIEFKFLKALNWSFGIGVDNFSFLFIILTSFLFCVTFLSCWSNTKSNLYFIELLFITEFILFLVFSSLDLVIFFITYEAVIIPVFLIIGIWGGRNQRVYAAYLSFYYTFAGSIAMLFSIVYIYLIVGSTSLFIVSNFSFTFVEQFFLFGSFFIAFASKLPLYPLHSWLPEAHVEAPTAGSVLLAGILLKMGGYGIIRWCFSLFSEISFLSSDLINTIAVVSILYASFSALQQLDIKRIIAYSSIAHMGFVVMGLFTFTESGLLGAIFLMVSHGFISAGLFLCIGVLYDRYGTRSILYYGGLAQLMPVYDTIFFFLCLANIAFPGTAGFPGEFLVLYSVYNCSPTMFFALLLGVLLTGVYTIWMYCRIMLGPIDVFGYIKKFSDINVREISVFMSLFFPTLIFGLFPNFIFHICNFWVIFLLSGISCLR